MPPSHLTKLVFRQLLGGQTIRHAGCTAPGRACRRHRRTFGSSTRAEQQRSFFGVSLFDSRKRAATEARLDPGMDKLQEHAKRLRLDARLNPASEIKQALMKFFSYKASARREIQDQQIRPLLQGYKYLRDLRQKGDEDAALDEGSLRTALKALSGPRRPRTQSDFQEGRKCGRLVILIFIDLLKAVHSSGQSILEKDIFACIDALCQCGQPTTAQSILLSKTWTDMRLPRLGDIDQTLEFLDSLPAPEFDRNVVLAKVLRGFAVQDQEGELLNTIQEAWERGMRVEDSQMTVAEVCGYYATKNDMAKAREWYNRVPSDTVEDKYKRFLPVFYEKLVRACIQNNDAEFGNAIVADILAQPFSSKLRDLVLVWAAGSGKGVEEIDRMASVMEQNTKEYQVSINTINGLISLALWRGNAYQAERFFHMGESRKITPNARTFIMQIDYRLAERDVDGALTAYARMQSQTAPAGDEAGESVNDLICAMCKTRRHDFDSIMNVAADLTDWGSRFEADTVATLAVLHLSRAETEDAEDLINTHGSSFSIDERQTVLNKLVDFCVDEETSDETAWVVYTLLKKSFDDMNRDQRTRMMKDFFRRQDATLATQIFEHMRLHTRADTVPTMQTYIDCGLGIAKLGDPEAFHMMYNLLKVDTSIEPTTALNNVLMVACVACGMPSRALTFWDAITASREGPDLASIQVMLRACEFAPEGAGRARGLHRQFLSSGLKMTEQYYGWLLAVLGAHECVGEALALVGQAQEEQGIAPSVLMLGSLANAIRSPQQQDEVLHWASERAPAVLRELQGRLLDTDVMGQKKYSIT